MNRRDKHAITIPFLMHRGDDKASWVEACSFSILCFYFRQSRPFARSTAIVSASSRQSALLYSPISLRFAHKRMRTMTGEGFTYVFMRLLFPFHKDHGRTLPFLQIKMKFIMRILLWAKICLWEQSPRVLIYMRATSISASSSSTVCEKIWAVSGRSFLPMLYQMKSYCCQNLQRKRGGELDTSSSSISLFVGRNSIPTRPATCT